MKKYVFLLIIVLILSSCSNGAPDPSGVYQKHSDIFNQISEKLFLLMDTEEDIIGESIYLLYDTDEIIGNSKFLDDTTLQNMLNSIRKDCKIYSVKLIDKNVISFSFGAYFNSVSGIFKTREKLDLNNYLNETDYARIDKIDEFTYNFSSNL